MFKIPMQPIIAASVNHETLLLHFFNTYYLFNIYYIPRFMHIAYNGLFSKEKFSYNPC